jgi:hypothetical protein
VDHGRHAALNKLECPIITHLLGLSPGQFVSLEAASCQASDLALGE